MLGEHVYARFTTALESGRTCSRGTTTSSSMYRGVFAQRRSRGWSPAGLVVLLVQTVRRRWFEGAVVLPVGASRSSLISFGTSKLYHYAYPFLPPLALAAGYLVALVWMLAPVQVRKILAACRRSDRPRTRRLSARRGVASLGADGAAPSSSGSPRGDARRGAGVRCRWSLPSGKTMLFKSSRVSCGPWRPSSWRDSDASQPAGSRRSSSR